MATDESGGIYIRGCRFCGRPCPVSEFCSDTCRDLWQWRGWWKEAESPHVVRGFHAQIN